MPNEHVATYFGGGYGISNISDYAFSMASGAGVTTDQIVRSNFSGEIGIVFALDSLHLRFGGEYLSAKTLEGVTGQSGGVPFFSLSSKISSLIPKVVIEIPFLKMPQTRLSLGGGMGLAAVTMEQSYVMTTAGSTALGVGDYLEKATASVVMWNVFVIGETLLVDTTTIGIEAGYRSLKVGELKSQKATSAITGPQTEGSTLLNNDGLARAFDFGGAYLNLSFRFWL